MVLDFSLHEHVVLRSVALVIDQREGVVSCVVICFWLFEVFCL